MSSLTLTELADRISNIMPAISREFLRNRPSGFYKAKLTMPQCVILDMLNRLGDMNMSDLAKSVGVTTAAMTGIVNRLVRDGYVTRVSDPADRRVIKIRMTTRGSKAIKDMNNQRRSVMIKLLSTLSQSEREGYLKILTRISDGIKG